MKSLNSLFGPVFVSGCLLLFSGRLAAQSGALTLQIGSPPPPPTPLVSHGDSWHYHKGTNAPQANWTTIDDASLDATWGPGNGGFGYADNNPELQLCQTILSDMKSNYSTFDMRRSFTVASAVDANMHLSLTMDWDDGFIAFLDGVFLASVNSPGTPAEPPFTAIATASHESSHGNSSPQPAITYDLGVVGSRLSVGTHVLAIVGLNQNKDTSSDFVQIADLQLTGGSAAAVNGGPFVALVQTNSVSLSGSNTIAGSSRVTVNGDDAAFSAGQGAWSKTQPLQPGVNRLFIAALDSSGAILAFTNYILVSEVSSTAVGGTLAGNTTWTSAMGIIHVTSTVVVPPGDSLSIAPGTVLIMANGANILATNASLTVTGTVSNPIYFFPSGTSVNWGELAVSGTGGNMLVQHIETIAGHLELFDGAIGTIEDSYFHDYEVSSPAILHTLGQPNHVTFNLRRCHVAHYYEVLSQFATNHIEDCLLEYQGNSGDGIDFDAGQPSSYIRRCTVRRGFLFNTDALDMGEFGATGSKGILIDSCLLHDFVDKGVSMGVGVDVTVTNTLIYNVDAGIAVKDNSTAGIYNNTIANANFGYHCYNKANPAAPDGGGFITNSFNNIIWNITNTTISLLNGSTLTATYSDFQGTNYPGIGNISMDPLFLNPAIHDYRVAGNSPTIGAGLDGANMGVTLPVGGIPAAPLNCAALAAGTGPITVTWIDDADNETGFLIERSNDGLSWQSLGSAAANAISYIDSTATLGQKYYYHVRATNSSGDSPDSNPASATRQPPVANVGGSISSDTVWLSGTHYVVTSSVAVAASATLTIQPGATICFNTGVGLTVANGGRLLAEGTTNAPILFTRAPGNTTTWTGVTINGSVGSPETRIAYAHFEFNANSPCLEVSAGTVFFDHLTFGNTAASYIHVDGASFIIQNCVFPSATTQFELVHGVGGIKSGGHGIFTHNFFGVPIGYNDVVDFTGGNRPGPIVQFINNVFIGATDDILDLDGTDAWVEGNIFLHAHKNGSPDTASAVSGSDDSGQTSEITIIGNIIYDCDNAVMGKGGNFYTLINNTIVHQSHLGGLDTDGAVLCLADSGYGEAAGMYVEGSIIYDAEKLLRFHTNSIVTFTNNLMQLPWTGLGGNNATDNPLFKHVPQLTETSNFTSWAEAQVVRDWFSLQTNSPALGTGPNGQDKGGVIPFGASISGEPVGTTTQTGATLSVGINRTGNGLPAAGWPNGSGFTHYKWRLDTNLVWSAETPITTPITLTGLGDGPHHVEVIGKNDAFYYKDDPAFAAEALVTLSRTWIVSSAPKIDSISVTAGTVHLQFAAEANTGYTVWYRDSLSSGNWQALVHLDPIASAHPVDFPDTPPAGTPMRFYRLSTP